MIMATASLYGTLRIIVILILIYYAVKFLFRLLAPVIIQQVVKKAEQNFQDLHQQQYNQHRPQADTNQAKPQEKKKVGEYIDYEEIE